MRPIHASPLALALVAASAPAAYAHGGSFGHARSVPYHAPCLPCDCGRADCPKCSAPGLETGLGLSKRETRTEVVEAWGEIAQVRVTTDFAAAEDRTFLEAFARVERSPLLAVTAGRVNCIEHDLTGVLAPSQGARRDYLWERDRRIRDPMLVVREGPGTVSMRVWPISVRGTTTATLEGFTLLAPPASGGTRIYRTGDLYLVVLPWTREVAKEADFVDEAGKRVLFVLSKGVCRARFGARADAAVEVPCVPALRDAIRGRGDASVNGATALVALPAGAHAPSNLFVGPLEDAPWINPRTLPGLAELSDPAPPPPPLPLVTTSPDSVVPSPAPASP